MPWYVPSKGQLTDARAVQLLTKTLQKTYITAMLKSFVE